MYVLAPFPAATLCNMRSFRSLLICVLISGNLNAFKSSELRKFDEFEQGVSFLLLKRLIETGVFMEFWSLAWKSCTWFLRGWKRHYMQVFDTFKFAIWTKYQDFYVLSSLTQSKQRQINKINNRGYEHSIEIIIIRLLLSRQISVQLMHDDG